MALLKSQRFGVLAMMAALTLMFSALLSVTLVAPAANANGGVSVSNMAIRSITIDPKTKVATAKGALTCTGAKRAYVGVEASQTVGHLHTAIAYGEKRLDCDGRERFSIKLTNYQGRLAPGEADVRAYAEAWTRFDYDFARFSGVLRVSNAH